MGTWPVTPNQSMCHVAVDYRACLITKPDHACTLDLCDSDLQKELRRQAENFGSDAIDIWRVRELMRLAADYIDKRQQARAEEVAVGHCRECGYAFPHHRSCSAAAQSQWSMVTDAFRVTYERCGKCGADRINGECGQNPLCPLAGKR